MKKILHIIRHQGKVNQNHNRNPDFFYTIKKPYSSSYLPPERETIFGTQCPTNICKINNFKYSGENMENSVVVFDIWLFRRHF